MKKIITYLFILSIFSCNKTSQQADSNDVISFMIDQKAIPLPPPPPTNDSTTTRLSGELVDSLLNVKLKVGIYPVLRNLTDGELNRLPSNYLKFFEISNSPSEKITLNKLSSKKGHEFILADTIELKKSKDYRDFDLLFNFSKIYFSKDKQKVLLSLGVSRSQLAGSGGIYVLEKKEKKWITEYYREIEIW